MTAEAAVDKALHDRVNKVMATVADPEIPVVSIVELGIYRGVSVVDGNLVVALTPTYSGCPATVAIQQSVRAALDTAGLTNVAIKIVLAPAWSTDMISDQGREKLRAYGISPPPKGADATSLRDNEVVQCPRCGSNNTREISRFGSTPCKALWQCSTCKEPFDSFKCH